MRSGRRAGGPALEQRLEALRRVVEIGRDRFPPGLVDDARKLLDRGAERLRLGADVTVAALAGATGSGKSSLFNRLAGRDLAPVGVRRPTTSAAQAAVWGEASEVLDWLGISRRHGMDDPALEGLVLLDLPDTDSTEAQHRLEVDRLVELVDVFVWVADPQKYADALLHEAYLRPLAGHAAVSVVVLNQIDRLTEAERRACVADLERLLKQDGLDQVRVLSTSASTGEGMESLRATIEERVRQERAAVQRLSADLDALGGRLAPLCGRSTIGLTPRDRDRLVEAMAEAGGVPAVSAAVAANHRREAALAMGWPFTRWLRRFRPDPLGRLHLGRAGTGGRTSLPVPTAVQLAQLDSAIRRTRDSAGAGLPEVWRDSVNRAAAEPNDDLVSELDAQVSKADLGETDRPHWWALANAVQTLLAVVALVGFAWLALLFGLEWLQIPRPPTPEVENVPWPTIALVGGLLAGFLISVVCQQIARLGARRRRRRAGRALGAGVAGVAEAQILSPIDTELEHYREFCDLLPVLRGGSSS